MTDIRTDGECFETANNLAVTMMVRGIHDIHIVHGLVTHPAAGFRHIHAWVEVEGLIFDYSHQVGFVMPRDRYYAAGEITGAEIHYYTVQEALDEALKAAHHGPWDENLIFKESTPEELEIDCNRPSAG